MVPTASRQAAHRCDIRTPCMYPFQAAHRCDIRVPSASLAPNCVMAEASDGLAVEVGAPLEAKGSCRVVVCFRAEGSSDVGKPLVSRLLPGGGGLPEVAYSTTEQKSGHLEAGIAVSLQDPSAVSK